MNSRLDEIINAVLYEGYILYPYRASSIKNQRERFTFGRVYPKWYSQAQEGLEPCVMQTQCLLEEEKEEATIEVAVRFLQPSWREIGMLDGQVWDGTERQRPAFNVVPELRLGGKVYQTWQEAIEREIRIPVLELKPCKVKNSSVHHSFQFEFGRLERWEPIRDEQQAIAGVMLRRSEAIEGEVRLTVEWVEQGLFKVSVRIENNSPAPGAEPQRDDSAALVLMRTFASAHTILKAEAGARFVSMIDPPEKWKGSADGCKNVGTWPVLVGDKASGERTTMLSSPIILYDYPEIAPESRGDFFDNTEIDEMLALRVMTMTPEEKREMRDVDARARKLLERAETLSSSELLSLHGANRERRSFDEEIFGSNTRLEGVEWNGAYLKSGDRVKIRPKERADVMDLALAGRTAVIEAVEQDAEKRIHLALVLDDDPGKDLGFQRQPGHRFFFGLEEVEVMG